MLAYLRDGSAQTILRAATLRWKLQINNAVEKNKTKQNKKKNNKQCRQLNLARLQLKTDYQGNQATKNLIHSIRAIGISSLTGCLGEAHLRLVTSSQCF